MKGRIRIAGEDIPCRLTMGAIMQLKEKTGIDLMAVQEGQPLDLPFILALIWACICSSCKAEGLPLPCTESQLADRMELADFILWQRENFATEGELTTKKK